MLTKLDPADHIETIADAIEYLTVAAEGDDPVHFMSAVEDVRRTRLRKADNTGK